MSHYDHPVFVDGDAHDSDHIDHDEDDVEDPTYQPDGSDEDVFYDAHSRVPSETHHDNDEDEDGYGGEYFEDEDEEQGDEPPLSKGPMFPVPDIPYVSVEFPGYINNPDRALEMLGGPAAIAKCLSTNPPDQPKDERPGGHIPLELRLSPEDPFTHPVFGEVIPTCNILLRVVRRRRRGTGEPWEYVSQVRGIIHETGRFRGMADYQWMPDLDDPVTHLRQAMKSMDLETLKQFPLEVPDETVLDNLRQFPPPIFSQVELPLPYDYKQNPAVVKVQIQHPDGSNSVRLLNRSREAGLPITSVASHHPTPANPLPQALAQLANIPAHMVDVVKAIFATRPIWTRLALINEIKRHHDPAIARRVQRILPAVAYYFISGPWKMTWVRFGFDPRTDKETRMWQTLDTRNHFKAGWQRAKRKSFTTVPHAAPTMNSPWGQEAADGAPQGADAGMDDEFDEHQIPDEDADHRAGTTTTGNGRELKSHVFDGVHMNDETSVFMFCDLVDPTLKELVDTTEYLRESCDPFDGWYYRGLILKLRARLRNKRLALATGEPYVPPPEDYMEVVMDGARDDGGEPAGGTTTRAVHDSGTCDGDGDVTMAEAAAGSTPQDEHPRRTVLAEVDALMRNLNVPGVVSAAATAARAGDEDIFDVFDFDPFEEDEDDEVDAGVQARQQRMRQQSQGHVPGRLSLGSQVQPTDDDDDGDVEGEASDGQAEDDEELSAFLL